MFPPHVSLHGAAAHPSQSLISLNARHRSTHPAAEFLIPLNICESWGVPEAFGERVAVNLQFGYLLQKMWKLSIKPSPYFLSQGLK